MAVYDDQKEKQTPDGTQGDSGSGPHWEIGGSNSSGTGVSPSGIDKKEREAGFTNQAGSSSGGASSSTADSPHFLKNREEGGEDSGNEGWASEDFDNVSSSSTSKGRARFTRRRAAVAGVGATTVIGAVIAFLSISSGPLEFVHIAQLMEKFHFSSQQDAEDGRLMKIARYLNDPAKPQNTRLGIVGNAVANRLESKINDATGLSSEYDKTSGRFLGYTADPAHENFKDMSPDEMKDYISSKYGIDRNSIQTTTINGKETIQFNPDTTRTGSPLGYFKQTAFARNLLGEAGLSKVSGRVGARVLAGRGGWTFHPIKALDSAYQAKLVEGGKKALDTLKEQFNNDEKTAINNADPVPTTTEYGTEDNGKGKATPNQTKTEAAGGGKSFQDQPSEANLKTKIAGGGAALIGVACVLQGINDAVPKLREAKVIMPMEKFAGQFVSLGSQVQSGQDLTTTQLGLYKQFLDGTNSSGKVTSTWNQAQSIQYQLGEPQNGTDIPKSAQVFNAGVPFGFIQDIPGISTVCGALGSPLGQVLGWVIQPFASAFQSVAISPLISDYTNWISGVPIDIFKGAGAVDGGYIDYGSKLSGNEEYASAGGVQLSSGQQAALTNTTNTLDNAQFQSKSLAYRIFNPDDDQTLASKVIDSYGVQSAPQGFASLVSSFGDIFANSVKSIASLLSGIGHVNAAPPYDYHGLKTVGFSANDLANPDYDNPFANACAVTGGQGCPSATGILGDPNDPNKLNQAFISRALTCFGDTISPDGGNWNVKFTNSQPTSMAYANEQDYKNAGCADTDPGWTRVRFWLIDTHTIESYDCYDGSPDTASQSCQDIGFSGSSSGSSSGQSSGSISGYQNPLRDVKNLTASRIDQGVDYTGTGNVYAIGNGTINGVYQNWYKTEPLIAYTLSDGPASGKTVYFAECITPNPDIASGKLKNVTSTTVIGQMTDCGNGIETGWANPAHLPDALAASCIGSDHNNASAYGINFSQLLQKLGAPPGNKGGTETCTLPAGWPTW